jgi:hypothetical protein
MPCSAKYNSFFQNKDLTVTPSTEAVESSDFDLSTNSNKITQNALISDILHDTVIHSLLLYTHACHRIPVIKEKT